MERTGTLLKGRGNRQEYQGGKGRKGKIGFCYIKRCSKNVREKFSGKTNIMAESQGRDVTLLSRLSIVRLGYESIGEIALENITRKRIE